MSKKMILFLLLVILLPVLLCGCCLGCMMISSHNSSKSLLHYYSDSPVTAARYFWKGGDDSYRISELPQDRLEEFTLTLDSMKVKYHVFHTDYFWGGQFGIELDLADGTFLTYDGTELELRSFPVEEKKEYKEYHIKSDFLEVTNCDFWEEMEQYFDFGLTEPLGTGW